MSATPPKPIPLSRLRVAYRRARFIARYVQGTMGLEGQGLDKAEFRRLVRASLADAIRTAT